MAPHYLTTTAWLIVIVFIVDEVTSNSLFKLRVKRDKRPTGTPISLPIQSTSTDDVFLGGTGSIGSGFIQTNFDESSLTKLQVPGISPTSNVGFSPSIKDDDSLTTLQVPGVSRPSFSSADFDESSLTRLQVPGFSRPNVGASTTIDDDESLTKLQVPGISRPNTGSITSSLDEASLTQLQVPAVSRPNSGGFSPITSDDSSGKRQVSTTVRPAGSKFTAIDVDDADVKEIAAFVTTDLSKTLGRLRLVKIIEAETQDVAGKNYKLTLRLKNLSEDDGKHLICEVVVFDQSWTNTRIVRESDCSPTKAIPTSNDDIGLDVVNPFSISFPPNAVTEATPTKRQTPSTPRPIGGGYSPIDVDDDVKEIAVFAGTAITAKRNAGPAKVTKIVKAESQIVAGTNFKLTLELNQPSALVEKHIICDVVVFDQPWTKTRLLSEYSCKQNKNPSITTDSLVLDGKDKKSGSSSSSTGTDTLPKRETFSTSSLLTAKFSSVDVDDPDVKEVADFAMKVANTAAATSGHSAPVKLIKILKAEWQVVDAVSRNFKLTLELDDGAEESLLCVVSVLEESIWKNNSSWTNSRTLTESTCPFAKTLFFPLPFVYRNPNMGHKLIATILFLLIVMVLLIDTAALPAPEKRQFLPWIRPKREKIQASSPIKTSVSDSHGSNNSGPIGGDFSPIDVEDAEVKEIAQFATAAIASSRNSGPLRVTKIVKAESQAVAGTNYKLTLELTQLVSEGDIVCDVVVFDQPWTDTRILSESHCISNKNPSISSNELGLTSSTTVATPLTEAPKRQLPTVSRQIGGGFYPINVDDAGVKEMAAFAVSSIASSRNSGPAQLTRIATAESQIVAGTNYKLTLELHQPSAIVDKDIICKVVIFDQPWTKTRILSESNCTKNENPNDSIVETQSDGEFLTGIEQDTSNTPNKRHIPSSSISSNSGFFIPNPELTLVKKGQTSERLIGSGLTKTKVVDGQASKSKVAGTVGSLDDVSLVDLTETSFNDSQILSVGVPAQNGFSSINVNDPDVKDIASYAATAISSSRNTINLKLQKILSAETKTLDGTDFKLQYILTLELDHFIAGAKGENLLCKVIVFDQKGTEHRKMTDSLCLPIKNATITSADEVVIDASTPILSGFSAINVTSPDVAEMAEFATSVISSSKSGPVKLTEIVKAESQIHAAGRNYKLSVKLDNTAKEGSEGNLLCEVIVFYQTWTNTRILSESNCLPIKTSTVAGPRYVPRYKEDISLPVSQITVTPGPNVTDQFSPIDVNDAKVREIAAFATSAISANSDSGPVVLLRILRAESQVVAGKNYKLILELFGADRDILLCDVVVFDHPKKKTRVLTDSKCTSNKTPSVKIHDTPSSSTSAPTEIDFRNIDWTPFTKRQIPGIPTGLSTSGFTPVDVDNAEVKEMANFATSSINGASESPIILQLVKVVDAETKFLFGKNFKLILRVKNMVKGVEGENLLCEVVVFDQSWTNTRKLTESTCFGTRKNA
ncbi:hypothetical protein GHT06_017919 [Daphnia sinensis]|uniref:Cystatin domain-containing protein n=1 Tax=Daphnia sinensis TaxID=1820382 RepID=A0AAD5PSN4_9CRUS|nr:hypothetical protein GHT06_017919 [Daphnia sinensis]